MGSIIGKSMDANMEKQQAFMLMSQKAQLERQMHMQNVLREQQMAMSLAKARDTFKFFSAFYGTITTLAIIGVMRTKRPTPLIPVIVIFFPFAYQYDMARGNKMNRIKEEAARILKEERGLLDLPETFPPSIDTLDKLRGSVE